MAEELHRNPGDTAAYGYRQLPGAGNARGIDLKTLTYGVFGVALGIVVGTLAADGSLRAMFSATSLHSVQASTNPPKPTAPPALKLEQAPPPEVHAAALETAKPVHILKSAEVRTPEVKVSVTVKPRPAHRHAARRRHTGRRRIHSRRRAHLHAKPNHIINLQDKAKVSSSIIAAKLFTYMVEGDVTVASYDASLGRIDTYEGETFSLNQIASLGDIVPLDAYPGNLHYRCDQSWNCTLFRDGNTIFSAKRTK